ncbi:uncharacterized protein LOC143222359 [Tachypleus tridentatus]|uniref:uncharacterized protein LOC143222359 n=1 Tax=Tachypleus tridentatus TaxID=6853 RepID=UPI003FD06E14
MYKSLFDKMESSGGTHENSDLSSEERKHVIYMKHENPSIHEATSSEVSESHVQGQLVGYLEVEDSDINSDENIICLPRQIEIDGEHVILTHDEHSGEIIVVVNTAEEDIQSQRMHSGDVMLGGEQDNFSEGHSVGCDEHSMESEYMFQLGGSVEAPECSIACSKTPGTFIDNQNVIECHDDINDISKPVIEHIDSLTIANNKESFTKEHLNDALSSNLKNNSEKKRGSCSSSAALDLSSINAETNLSSEDGPVRESEDLCDWVTKSIVSKCENKSVPYSVQEQEFIQSESCSNYEQELHTNDNFVSSLIVTCDTAGVDNLIYSNQAATEDKCTQQERSEPLDIIVDDTSKKCSESELKEHHKVSSTENKLTLFCCENETSNISEQETESKKDLPVDESYRGKKDISPSSSEQVFLTTENRITDTVKSGTDKCNQYRSTNVITFAHSSQNNIHENDNSKLNKETVVYQSSPFLKLRGKDEISSDVEQITPHNSEESESVMDKIGATVSDKGVYLKQTSTEKDCNSNIMYGETISKREDSMSETSTDLVCDSKSVNTHFDAEKRMFSDWLIVTETSEVREGRTGLVDNVCSYTPFNILDEEHETGKTGDAEYKDEEIRKATSTETEDLVKESIEIGEKVKELEIDSQFVVHTIENVEDKLSENQVFKLKTNVSKTEDKFNVKENYEAVRSAGEKQIYESAKLTENENSKTSNRTEGENYGEFCAGRMQSFDKNVRTFSYSNKITVEETSESIEAEQKDNENMVIKEGVVSEVDDQARENISKQGGRGPDIFEKLEDNYLILEKQSATVIKENYTPEKYIESNRSISEEHESTEVENIQGDTVPVQNFGIGGKIENNVKCVKKQDVRTESHRSEEIAENMSNVEQKISDKMASNIENKTDVRGNMEFSEKRLVENIESTLEDNSITEEQSMTGNSLKSAKTNEELVERMEYIMINRCNVEMEENLKDMTSIKGFKTTEEQSGNKILENSDQNATLLDTTNRENSDQDATLLDTTNGVSETDRMRICQNEKCLEKELLRTFSENSKYSEDQVGMSLNTKNSAVIQGTTTTTNLAAVTVLQSLEGGTNIKKGNTDKLCETQESEEVESDKNVSRTSLIDVQFSSKFSEEGESSQSIITSENRTLILKRDKTDDAKDIQFDTTKEIWLPAKISDNLTDSRNFLVESTMKEQSLDNASENLEQSWSEISEGNLSDRTVLTTGIKEQESVAEISQGLENEKHFQNAPLVQEQYGTEICEYTEDVKNVQTQEKYYVTPELDGVENTSVEITSSNRQSVSGIRETSQYIWTYPNTQTTLKQLVPEVSSYLKDDRNVETSPKEKQFVKILSEDTQSYKFQSSLTVQQLEIDESITSASTAEQSMIEMSENNKVDGSIEVAEPTEKQFVYDISENLEYDKVVGKAPTKEQSMIEMSENNKVDGSVEVAEPTEKQFVYDISENLEYDEIVGKAPTKEQSMIEMSEDNKVDGSIEVAEPTEKQCVYDISENLEYDKVVGKASTKEQSMIEMSENNKVMDSVEVVEPTEKQFVYDISENLEYDEIVGKASTEEQSMIEMSEDNKVDRSIEVAEPTEKQSVNDISENLEYDEIVGKAPTKEQSMIEMSEDNKVDGSIEVAEPTETQSVNHISENLEYDEIVSSASTEEQSMIEMSEDNKVGRSVEVTEPTEKQSVNDISENLEYDKIVGSASTEEQSMIEMSEDNKVCISVEVTEPTEKQSVNDMSENLEYDEIVSSASTEEQSMIEMSEDNKVGRSVEVTEPTEEQSANDMSENVEDDEIANDASAEEQSMIQMSEDNEVGRSVEVTEPTEKQSVNDVSENLEYDEIVGSASTEEQSMIEMSEDKNVCKSIECAEPTEKQSVNDISENLEYDNIVSSASTAEQSMIEISEDNKVCRSVKIDEPMEKQSVSDVSQSMEYGSSVKSSPTIQEQFVADVSENIVVGKSVQITPIKTKQFVNDKASNLEYCWSIQRTLKTQDQFMGEISKESFNDKSVEIEIKLKHSEHEKNVQVTTEPEEVDNGVCAAKTVKVPESLENVESVQNVKIMQQFQKETSQNIIQNTRSSKDTPDSSSSVTESQVIHLVADDTHDVSASGEECVNDSSFLYNTSRKIISNNSESLTPKIKKAFQKIIHSPTKSVACSSETEKHQQVQVNLTLMKSKISNKLVFESLLEEASLEKKQLLKQKEEYSSGNKTGDNHATVSKEPDNARNIRVTNKDEVILGVHTASPISKSNKETQSKVLNIQEERRLPSDHGLQKDKSVADDVKKSEGSTNKYERKLGLWEKKPLLGATRFRPTIINIVVPEQKTTRKNVEKNQSAIETRPWHNFQEKKCHSYLQTYDRRNTKQRNLTQDIERGKRQQKEILTRNKKPRILESKIVDNEMEPAKRRSSSRILGADQNYAASSEPKHSSVIISEEDEHEKSVTVPIVETLQVSKIVYNEMEPAKRRSSSRILGADQNYAASSEPKHSSVIISEEDEHEKSVTVPIVETLQVSKIVYNEMEPAKRRSSSRILGADQNYAASSEPKHSSVIISEEDEHEKSVTVPVVETLQVSKVVTRENSVSETKADSSVITRNKIKGRQPKFKEICNCTTDKTSNPKEVCVTEELKADETCSRGKGNKRNLPNTQQSRGFSTVKTTDENTNNVPVGALTLIKRQRLSVDGINNRVAVSKVKTRSASSSPCNKRKVLETLDGKAKRHLTVSRPLRVRPVQSSQVKEPRAIHKIGTRNSKLEDKEEKLENLFRLNETQKTIPLRSRLSQKEAEQEAPELGTNDQVKPVLLRSQRLKEKKTKQKRMTEETVQQAKKEKHFQKKKDRDSKEEINNLKKRTKTELGNEEKKVAPENAFISDTLKDERNDVSEITVSSDLVTSSKDFQQDLVVDIDNKSESKTRCRRRPNFLSREGITKKNSPHVKRIISSTLKRPNSSSETQIHQRSLSVGQCTYEIYDKFSESERQHKRAKTEPLGDIKEISGLIGKTTLRQPKNWDLRIRCQRSPDKVTSTASLCCFQCGFVTSRIENLIYHHKEQCPKAVGNNPWDLGQEAVRTKLQDRFGASRLDSQKGPSGNKLDTSSHVATFTKKSKLPNVKDAKSSVDEDRSLLTKQGPRESYSTRSFNKRKEEICKEVTIKNKVDKKVGQNRSEDRTNTDEDLLLSGSDDDDGGDVNSSIKNAFGFDKDDVVWVVLKDLWWPAVVHKVDPKLKKVSVKFIGNPEGKKGSKTDISMVVTFNDAKMNKKFLSLPTSSEESVNLVKAVQKAEDFLRKRCLGIKVNAAQFFGFMDRDFFDSLSESESDSCNLLEAEVVKRQRKFSESSSFLIEDPTTGLTNTQISEDIEVSSSKREKKEEVIKLLRCIKSGRVENHLLGVYSGSIASQRHTNFHSEVPSERNQLQHSSWFSPFEEEDQQEEIYDYCLQLFKSNFDPVSSFDTVAYMFEVWIPEAIIKAISRERGTSLHEAEIAFENWTSLD